MELDGVDPMSTFATLAETTVAKEMGDMTTGAGPDRVTEIGTAGGNVPGPDRVIGNAGEDGHGPEIAETGVDLDPGTGRGAVHALDLAISIVAIGTEIVANAVADTKSLINGTLFK